MEERTVYLFEFSPDGGKRWFPLTNEKGHRIWASVDKLPESITGWRSLVRASERQMSFQVLPDDFDKGIYGSQRQEDNQEGKWLQDRTKVGISFTSDASGFHTKVNAADQRYELRRKSEPGEPIWMLIGDVMDWYDTTLSAIEPRGIMGRDCIVLVTGVNPTTGLNDTASLGVEFRLWDFLLGWMTTTGMNPWSETE